MKKTGVFLRSWTGLFFVGILLMVGCQQAVEPEQPTQRRGARVRVDQTIAQVVMNAPEFRLLRRAVVRAGLGDALATGNLTVFAPTDAAFRQAGFDGEEAINAANVDALRRILLYHVVGTGRVFAQDVPETLTGVRTLQGEEVWAVRDRFGSVAINGNIVTQPDLEANNGVIHVLDRVLMPPMGNTTEVALTNPDLTYLVAALVRASEGGSDLVNVVATTQNITVFAPTNAAFQAAGFPTIESVRAANPAALRRILLYHVVAGRQFTAQFNVGEFRTLEGRRLATTQSPAGVNVQGDGNAMPANVRVRNLNTINGVVHVIDQVLLPEGQVGTRNITEIVVASPEFSLLRAAVVRADLTNALGTTRNITVFAPTNAAFRAAGFADENAINGADVNTLRRILLYHVLPDRILAGNVPERITGVNTLQGERVFVLREQRGISVNGINVVQANVPAENGVIHAIDRVLMVPTGNIVEVAVANPNLSYLVAAVQRAGLSSTLVTDTYTVFAPTNAAFQAAGFPTLESVQGADPATLTRILLYHVVAGRNYAGNLRTDNLRTAQGGDVFVTAMHRTVTVKGRTNTTAANVVAADVDTKNGVVHVVDQVLLP
jgi:transforming growth factor-beta-induced protein